MHLLLNTSFRLLQSGGNDHLCEIERNADVNSPFICNSAVVSAPIEVQPQFDIVKQENWIKKQSM